MKETNTLRGVTSYEYDALGQLVKVTMPEGNSTAFEYDAMGNLTRIVNSDGTFTRMRYDANSRLTTVWDEANAAVAYELNANGEITKITDAFGNSTVFAYDKLGRTSSVTDALGGVTKYSYDEMGNITEITDAMGKKTKYVYDELNRVTSMTDALGGVTLLEYDANGNIVKTTNPDGGVTRFTYDLLNRLVSFIDPEGYTFLTVYDANGNIVRSTDGRGNSRNMAYDALNRLVTDTDESGFASAVVYDAEGRILRFTDPEGAVTAYQYDRNGNVTKVTDALGNATTFTYDVMDRVSSITDANGGVTRYAYTPTGSIAKITDALNGITSFEYDVLGRLTKETNQNREATAYAYDALGCVISVTNPLGHRDRFSYDALGRITAVTDRNGGVTRYVYDANGNVVETKDALGHSSYFEYDAMNRLVKVTLNRVAARHGVDENQVTLYSYDKRGLVTRTINAAGSSSIYVYDGNGSLVQVTDEDGYVTEYRYDPKNLVNAINYSDGSRVAFGYDKTGRLTVMNDTNGETNFTFDLLGQLLSVSDHEDRVVSYTYDAVGNRTSVSYPDGTSAQYAFDLLGRITKLTDAENQVTAYAYDPAGRLTQMTAPNGWTTTYAYDAAGQLTRQRAVDASGRDNRVIEHTYRYDAEGNIINETRSSGATGQERYDLTHTYDAMNRLTRTEGKWGFATRTYEYDSLGNLVYERNGNGSRAGNEYWYDNLNRQVRKQVDGKDFVWYTYDRRGNLTEAVDQKTGEVTAQYVYDAANRMVLGVNEKGEESRYIYNGLGVLIANEWQIERNAYGYAGLDITPTNGAVTIDALEILDEIITESETDGAVPEIPGSDDLMTDDPNEPVTDETDDSMNTMPENPIEPAIDELNSDIIPEIPGVGNPDGDDLIPDSNELESLDMTPEISVTAAPGNNAGTNSGGAPVLTHNRVIVRKDYVVDYSRAYNKILMEYEAGADGLTYRYTYGLEHASGSVASSVVIYGIPNGAGSVMQTYHGERVVKLWYHHDRLGSSEYLTNNLDGGVMSYVSYDSWGAPTMKPVLQIGVRQLDLVTGYTGFIYDPVMGAYYAQARMYDAENRRFMAVDPVRGSVSDPQSMVQYTYVLNNPLRYVDPDGRTAKNAGAGLSEKELLNAQKNTLKNPVNPTDDAIQTLKDAVNQMKKKAESEVSPGLLAQFLLGSGSSDDSLMWSGDSGSSSDGWSDSSSGGSGILAEFVRISVSAGVANTLLEGLQAERNEKQQSLAEFVRDLMNSGLKSESSTNELAMLDQRVTFFRVDRIVGEYADLETIRSTPTGRVSVFLANIIIPFPPGPIRKVQVGDVIRREGLRDYKYYLDLDETDQRAGSSTGPVQPVYTPLAIKTVSLEDEIKSILAVADTIRERVEAYAINENYRNTAAMQLSLYDDRHGTEINYLTGLTFADMDDAARAFGIVFQPISMLQQQEWGATIDAVYDQGRLVGYKIAHITNSFLSQQEFDTPSNKTTLSNFDRYKIDYREDDYRINNSSAIIHTHWVLESNNYSYPNFFSGDPTARTHESMADFKFTVVDKKTQYLVGSNGDILKMTPDRFSKYYYDDVYSQRDSLGQPPISVQLKKSTQRDDIIKI